MKLLYTTSSLSFTQLVCLTFDREEIPYFSSDTDPATSGLGSPFMMRQCRIYLLHDEHWGRAVELLQELGAFSAKEQDTRPPAKRMPTWLVVGAGVLLAMLFGAVLSN